MKKIENLLEDTTYITIDALCKHVQKELNIKYGDGGGIFFNETENMNKIKSLINDYITFELEGRNG